jgi:lysophospholipase L1-like esterase
VARGAVAAFAAFAVVLLAGCGSSTGGRGLGGPVRPPVRLTVIGDSLAAGYYASTADHAFPQLVAREMRHAGEAVTTTVVSRAGATTADAQRWKVGITSDVVVVELGTNDWGDAVSIDQFTTRYQDVLARVRAASPKARLLCMGEWAGADEQNGIGIASRQYDAAVQRACSAARGTYVDIAAAYDDPANHGPAGAPSFLGSSDWFHPNDAGHRALADDILGRVLGRGRTQLSPDGDADSPAGGDGARAVAGVSR